MSDLKRFIRDYYEQHAAKDLDGVASRFAVDAVFIDAAGPTVFQGRDAIRDAVRGTWKVFPDLRIDIVHVATDERLVLVELNLVGTHQDELLGRKPTGRVVRWSSAGSYELNDTKNEIVREAYYYDSGTVLAQIDPE